MQTNHTFNFSPSPRHNDLHLDFVEMFLLSREIQFITRSNGSATVLPYRTFNTLQLHYPPTATLPDVCPSESVWVLDEIYSNPPAVLLLDHGMRFVVTGMSQNFVLLLPSLSLTLHSVNYLIYCTYPLHVLVIYCHTICRQSDQETNDIEINENLIVGGFYKEVTNPLNGKETQ